MRKTFLHPSCLAEQFVSLGPQKSTSSLFIFARHLYSPRKQQRSFLHLKNDWYAVRFLGQKTLATDTEEWARKKFFKMSPWSSYNNWRRYLYGEEKVRLPKRHLSFSYVNTLGLKSDDDGEREREKKGKKRLYSYERRFFFRKNISKSWEESQKTPFCSLLFRMQIFINCSGPETFLSCVSGASLSFFGHFGPFTPSFTMLLSLIGFAAFCLIYTWQTLALVKDKISSAYFLLDLGNLAARKEIWPWL